MEPFRVAFHFVTPVRAPDAPIHLDALLAWAAVDAAGGDLSAQEDLPLARHETDSGWVWKASRLVFRDIHGRGVMPSIRAFRMGEWADERGRYYAGGRENKFKSGTGPYKAYMFSHPLLVAGRAEAWGIGDRIEIERLLLRVSHIGKLRRLDLGRISAFQVGLCEEAERLWRLRVMPEPADGYRRVVSPLRAPYWDRSKRVAAWEPGREAVEAVLTEARLSGVA